MDPIYIFKKHFKLVLYGFHRFLKKDAYIGTVNCKFTVTEGIFCRFFLHFWSSINYVHLNYRLVAKGDINNIIKPAPEVGTTKVGDNQRA